jgi:CubicO group peptidase (beta-lactamase class C family)
MLLNGGELGGVRILGRKTVELMRSNHVEYLNPRPKDRWVPPGFGFGVRVRRDRADEFESLGSPGQFGWEGILTSYVSIDPRERMFVLLLMQHQPYDEGGVFEKFSNTVYQALEK